jgi:hypothetical protein
MFDMKIRSIILPLMAALVVAFPFAAGSAVAASPQVSVSQPSTVSIADIAALPEAKACPPQNNGGSGGPPQASTVMLLLNGHWIFIPWPTR